MAADKIGYLEDERKKLWAEVEILRGNKKRLDDEILYIKEKISELEKKVPEDIRTIKNASKQVSEYKNKVSANKDEALQSLEDIKHCHQVVQDNLREIDATATTINNKVEEIEANAERIAKVSEQAENAAELFDDLESIKSKLSILSTLSEDTKTTQQKISINLANSTKYSEEIKELYFDLFGYEEENEHGEKVLHSGKVEELVDAYTELSSQAESTKKSLNQIIEENKKSTAKLVEDCSKNLELQNTAWEAKVHEVVQRINSLLPNALTAGLSHAYTKKREAEQVASQSLSLKFTWTIFVLALVSLLPVSIAIYYAVTSNLDKAIGLLPNLATAIIPIYVPILWLAYSINKRLNLSKRLVEEYTHKEVLSNTFEGLSKQVESIKDDHISNELRIKLLYNLLNVSSENPGKLISDYNKSDHPVLDVLEKSSKLNDAVESLSKIPGISALSKILETKAETSLKAQNIKVENGIEIGQATLNGKDKNASNSKKSEDEKELGA